MKHLLIVMTIALLLAVGHCAKADDADLLHFSAHFGMSFAISAFAYQTWRKGLGCTETESVIFAVATTTFAGLFYKYLEGFPSDTGRAIIYNSIGIGASYVVLHF